MAAEPPVSVIVPTRNEARNLPRLLASIRRQRSVAIECIVVDQASDDGTPDIARDFGCHVVEMGRPAFYTPPGRARNLGAEVARGTVLLHLDADMELADDCSVAELLRLFDDGHRAVVIPEDDVSEGFWGRCKALERRCYRGTVMEAARAVRRDLFDEVGGYDAEIGSGEDVFVSRRYDERTEVRLASSLVIRHHTGRQQLSGLLRKKFHYGRTVPVYLDKAAAAGDISPTGFVGACLRAYARNVRHALTHPSLYLAIFPLRLLEFAALRLGMAVSRFGGRSPRSRCSPSGRSAR